MLRRFCCVPGQPTDLQHWQLKECTSGHILLLSPIWAIQPQFTIQTVLSFLEFLHSNSVSPHVIVNYVSSLKTAAKKYKWDSEPLHHQLVSAYLRSISINSFTPTPRGPFDLETLMSISKACDRLQDPLLYRAIFLTSYFAFLRMSNIAPHCRARFDPGRHLLRQDIIFASPGAHIIFKWSKTMQNRTVHQFVQIPQLLNSDLCPVTAIKSLLDSKPLPPLHLYLYMKNQVASL